MTDEEWVAAEQEHEDRARVKAWTLASHAVYEMSRKSVERAEEAIREAQHRLIKAQERQAEAEALFREVARLAGDVL